MGVTRKDVVFIPCRRLSRDRWGCVVYETFHWTKLVRKFDCLSNKTTTRCEFFVVFFPPVTLLLSDRPTRNAACSSLFHDRKDSREGLGRWESSVFHDLVARSLWVFPREKRHEVRGLRSCAKGRMDIFPNPLGVEVPSSLSSEEGSEWKGLKTQNKSPSRGRVPPETFVQFCTYVRKLHGIAVTCWYFVKSPLVYWWSFLLYWRSRR